MPPGNIWNFRCFEICIFGHLSITAMYVYKLTIEKLNIHVKSIRDIKNCWLVGWRENSIYVYGRFWYELDAMLAYGDKLLQAMGTILISVSHSHLFYVATRTNSYILSSTVLTRAPTFSCINFTCL